MEWNLKRENLSYLRLNKVEFVDWNIHFYIEFDTTM